MKRRVFSYLTIVITGLCISTTVSAELQKIQVGGKIQIRGNYWSPEWFGFGQVGQGTPFAALGIRGPAVSRGPLETLFGRGIPDVIAPFPLVFFVPGLSGTIQFDDEGNSVSNVEQRTRLNVSAQFSDNITAFIELDSNDTWGEDFRSDYITGVDARGVSSDDVEFFQAYIDIRELGGYEHLNLRIGRQEIELGNRGQDPGWLVSNVDEGLFFGGVSFDGIRFDYAREMFGGDFELTGFWTKLADTSPLEEDGDVDFYGTEVRFLKNGAEGFLETETAVYWLFIRDARSREENPFLFQGASPFAAGVSPRPAPVIEFVEGVFGVDDHDPSQLHTIGLRSFGRYVQQDFKWELQWKGEVAYQFGDASSSAFAQIPVNSLGNSVVSPFLGGAGVIPFAQFIYGDSDAEWDVFGADASVRLTLTPNERWEKYKPTLTGRLTYYEGDDNSDITFWERINPFSERDASVSFNRLFSEDEHSDFLDIEANLSNVWIAAVGIESNITEEVIVRGQLSYFEAVDTFDRSVYGPFALGILGANQLGILSSITRESDDELGWELGLDVQYDYSEDLVFKAGWSHFFVGDGLEDGNFIDLNGLGLAGGLDGDDADYLWFSTTLKF